MWKIIIATTDTGVTMIGADAVNSYPKERIADIDRVFGSQIGYRCAALTPNGYRIMTPTQARKRGFETTQGFPGPR